MSPDEIILSIRPHFNDKIRSKIDTAGDRNSNCFWWPIKLIPANLLEHYS